MRIDVNTRAFLISEERLSERGKRYSLREGRETLSGREEILSEGGKRDSLRERRMV